VAAQEFREYQHLIANQPFLVLGAGVGKEAQAVAQRGAQQVVATDNHSTDTQLVAIRGRTSWFEFYHSRASLGFLAGTDPLPQRNVMIIADVLYNERLALLPC